jgi:hypothetical protein
VCENVRGYLSLQKLLQVTKNAVAFVTRGRLERVHRHKKNRWKVSNIVF